MSCNGCRVLRKGCSDSCALRTCLQWIDTPDSQSHATVFLAKFFGRAALISFISSVPDSERPAVFQSLLFEACGRTINPVDGAVGLLRTGNWHLCQAAVHTVIRGETLHPLPDGIPQPELIDGRGLRSRNSRSIRTVSTPDLILETGLGSPVAVTAADQALEKQRRPPRTNSHSMNSDQESGMTNCHHEMGGSGLIDYPDGRGEDSRLLNLFN